MITLSILKALENDGFGTIDTDLFTEEVPLDNKGVPKQGLWIVTRGSAVSRLNIDTQSFDIYSRYNNKVTGYTKLSELLQWLQEGYSDVCTLPAVPPYTSQEYKNVRLFPTSGIENVGTDENGKVVRVISGEVYFKKENT